MTRGRTSLTAQGLELLMDAAQKLEQIVVAFRSRGTPPEMGPLMRTLRDIAGREGTNELERNLILPNPVHLTPAKARTQERWDWWFGAAPLSRRMNWHSEALTSMLYALAWQRQARSCGPLRKCAAKVCSHSNSRRERERRPQRLQLGKRRHFRGAFGTEQLRSTRSCRDT